MEKPKCTHAPDSSKPKKNNEKGGKGRYPTGITIEGFENKHRPKRLLPKIPDEFIRTDEIRDIIWWNGFTATDYIWKKEGSEEQFVIRGARKYEIFNIIGIHEDGRSKADRYYYHGLTSSQYVK